MLTPSMRRLSPERRQSLSHSSHFSSLYGLQLSTAVAEERPPATGLRALLENVRLEIQSTLRLLSQ